MCVCVCVCVCVCSVLKAKTLLFSLFMNISREVARNEWMKLAKTYKDRE